MSTPTPKELAAKPAGEDQIARAEVIAAASPKLQQQLSAFLATGPNRGQMLDFMEEMKIQFSKDQLREKATALCRVAGIENPSGADLLMAMQVGLAQEQNMILQNSMDRTLNQMRANAKANETDVGDVLIKGLGFGTLIGAILIS